MNPGAITVPTLETIMRHLQGPALPHADLTDGQLLDQFLARRDESAFETLVRRHGPMVLGVCRRVLRHAQDVEDAFQATFVVLVRKARAVVPRENVANWLYGVAFRTSLKARTMTARRRVREREVIEMPDIETARRDATGDLEHRLDRELSHLPDAYRTAIILCDLEGKTRKEAARQLGLAEGTVASRLARGRSLLTARLSRHGMMVTAGLLTAALAERAAASALSAPLIAATVRAGLASTGYTATGPISANVAALSEGVMRTMLLSKLKIASIVFVACALLGLGGAALSQRAGAEKSADPPAKPASAEKPADTPAPKPTVAPAADKKDSTIPNVISGVAIALDIEKRTIIVQHRLGEDTFKIASDAKIEIDWRADRWEKVPKGANVVLGFFRDAKTAGNLQANGRWYYNARVKAVDAAARTLTIKDRGEEKTFPVSKSACITVDGKQTKLAAVPSGAVVNLGLTADQQRALMIGCDGEQLGECGGSLIKAVDTALNTITFDDKAPPVIAGKTFTVAKDALVTIDGKTGSLAALPVGAYVNIVLRTGGGIVGQINANGPSNVCDCHGSLVTAVDVEKGTITFDDKARAEVAGKTFNVAPNTIILVDGTQGKLADIPVGSYVQMRLWTDRQTIGQLTADGPSNICDCGGSLVTAVDVAKRTLTFSDNARAEVAGKTFTIHRNANITIDGGSGKLEAVSAGSYVQINLCVDRQIVGTIHATGPQVPGVGLVKAVDAEKNTVTVDEKTYPVATNANISVDGKTVKLNGVRPGIYVSLRLCVDQKTVGTIFHTKAP